MQKQLKQYPTIYLSFKEAMRVVQKMKLRLKVKVKKDRTSFNKLSIVLIINIDKVISVFILYMLL
jgi:hypothetical protein